MMASPIDRARLRKIQRHRAEFSKRMEKLAADALVAAKVLIGGAAFVAACHLILEVL